MFPALALVVGAGLDALARRLRTDVGIDTGRERGLTRGVFIPLGAFALLATVATALLPRLAAQRPELAVVGGDVVQPLIVLGTLLAAGSGLAAWLTARGRVRSAVAALAAAMGALMLVAAYAVLPRLDVVKSPRALAGMLNERMRPGERYAIFPRLDANVVFYARRFCTEIGESEELARFAASPERVWVVARRDAYAKLASPPPLTEVARDRDPVDGFLLLTNRP
jgi:hypothetical protein